MHEMQHFHMECVGYLPMCPSVAHVSAHEVVLPRCLSYPVSGGITRSPSLGDKNMEGWSSRLGLA
jgi:hypothetical protein